MPALEELRKRQWPHEFLGRCQHCLNNAYLNSNCSWGRDHDCVIRKARAALATEPKEG